MSAELDILIDKKFLLDLPVYQPGKPIEEVQREHKLKAVIKLASNENALGPSPKAVEAIKQSLKTIHRYPDGGAYYLKHRLAKKLGVGASSIILGNGSDELIVLTLRALIGGGDEVIVATPTFLIYEIAARACGATVVSVPLRHLRYDLPAIRRMVTAKTKIIFLANPDNPTGTYVTKEEVDALLDRLPPHVLVYFDEAYFEFVEERNYPNGLHYLARHPVMVTRSFSKAYGLAGLRIGYGVADARLISCLERLREPFNVNLLAQVAALAALDDHRHLAQTRKLVREGKRYLYRKFQELGLRYIPSATNFVLLDVGRDSHAVSQALLKLGVIVRDMTVWKLHQYLRVTIGTRAENERFVKALKKTLLRSSDKE
ncbi:MAG: histidinol-phosphate transaminase [Candidatus Omnitrophica bacterium]|nr:histidinol-phosphate transaminase [Candidatus Omnitrophota bacterium]